MIFPCYLAIVYIRGRAGETAPYSPSDMKGDTAEKNARTAFFDELAV